MIYHILNTNFRFLAHLQQVEPLLPLELELDHYGGDVSLGVLAEAYKLPVSVVHLREEKREAKLVRISQVKPPRFLCPP